ncbi:MAG: sulfatase-like hydrolase/transferase [Armatimonadetes bacterium]|nr:sulfatase-like hydrolase/transferase [Armatimonadota bacterium]
MPPGISDTEYVVAQYDGAVAYMDSAIQTILTAIDTHGLRENTIIALNGDHGETLFDHDCYFDHHGLYEPTIHVPLIVSYAKRIPAGARLKGYTQHKDLVPTLLDLAEIDAGINFDGHSLVPMALGEVASHETGIYITECTWMRKHGWRTPAWKLIIALEPDFHFKPEIELYDLVADPDENNNLAAQEPDVVAALTKRMNDYIARREEETGLPNPIHNQGDWHGSEGVGPFKTSQQAYDTLHIGDPKQAASLQAKSRE